MSRRIHSPLSVTLVALFLSAALLLPMGCQAPAPSGSAGSRTDVALDGGAEPSAGEVALLAEWMTGAFSSAGQAAQDPEFLDIRLHVAAIWPERDDGPWLYVEQAVAEKLERPYRQRVYRLVAQEDEVIESRVYTLPGDPLRFAGAWRAPELLGAVQVGDLEVRAGCSLYLRRSTDTAFTGSTTGRGCESTLRGATYTTSEARITPSEMITWDRGFDAEGKQVWGATAGGYIFRRVDEVPR
jgi:CpeT protein